jgi:predicted DNA-binding transcriptional regulator AlpA
MSIRENEIAERRRIRRKRKPISQAEAERREQQRQADRAERASRHVDRVLPFKLWCAVNAISEPTGIRIIKRRELPVVQLSERRIGIRESDNRAWQQSRVR